MREEPREAPVSEVLALSVPGRRAWELPQQQLVRAYFYVLWVLIGMVSLYDAYLVKVYQTIILDMERNPICEFLIRCEPMNLTYFLVGKACGTMLALGILWMLFRISRRLALPTISGVAIFQLGLFCYLTFARY